MTQFYVSDSLLKNVRYGASKWRKLRVISTGKWEPVAVRLRALIIHALCSVFITLVVLALCIFVTHIRKCLRKGVEHRINKRRRKACRVAILLSTFT